MYVSYVICLLIGSASAAASLILFAYYMLYKPSILIHTPYLLGILISGLIFGLLIHTVVHYYIMIDLSRFTSIFFQ